MTDEELEEFQDEMEKQGEELREDLGGDPEDYRKRPIADGGDE
jgi:hypothetical protein